mmetsp:Transcript_10509/g.18303  ORF Transcript_10509/g.18303 Transcript_10509/m.18303 type:complete len:124 (+) Transcript_10509:34-405(+)
MAVLPHQVLGAVLLEWPYYLRAICAGIAIIQAGCHWPREVLQKVLSFEFSGLTLQLLITIANRVDSLVQCSRLPHIDGMKLVSVTKQCQDHMPQAESKKDRRRKAQKDIKARRKQMRIKGEWR